MRSWVAAPTPPRMNAVGAIVRPRKKTPAAAMKTGCELTNASCRRSNVAVSSIHSFDSMQGELMAVVTPQH